MASFRQSRIFDLAKFFALREYFAVNSRIALNCFLFTLVSCGWDSESQPFEVESLPKVNQFSRERHQAKVESATELRKKKAFSGRVTFRGLTSLQLSQIRIIPESGSCLIEPNNKSYNQVDGLWVMAAKANEWFKIPDYSEAWVGEEPSEFEGTAHLGSLKIYYRSSPVLRVVGAMRHGLKNPVWVTNAGATMSPVPSPWETTR